MICGTLALITCAVFLPVIQHDFINFDDPEYVLENTQVKRGLTLESMRWAFTRVHANNWHPLTWWSHMLDCSLFGLNPGAHHLVNLMLHVAATLVLFSALSRLTGALWPSALVAALFAIHPLHLESVAWVAERKDVLSALFWMLTLWAYVRYVEESKAQAGGPKSRSGFGLVVLFFALGLLSKPMLVTLPFVLLLLDYWPLGRVSGFGLRVSSSGTQDPRLETRNFPALVKEKWPLFALSLLSCIVTFCAQKSTGAVVSVEQVSIGERIANALISYWRYLGKTVWPADLAVFYPRPAAWPLWQVVLAGSGLVLVSLLTIRNAKRRPFLLVGWLWYLGTLVPVIGLVQVGNQAMADRYTYIPLIGIFIAVVWLASELAPARRVKTVFTGAVAVVALLACAAVTRAQLQHWRNSLSLFEHALAVTTNNAVAHNNLGTALAAMGEKDEAMGHYTKALSLQPRLPLLQNNVGVALAREKKWDEAIARYREAIRLKPDYAAAYNNLGAALVNTGFLNEAATNFSWALNFNPDYPEALNNLGGVAEMLGRNDEAIEYYTDAVRLDPNSPDARVNLGTLLMKQGRLADAAAHFWKALRADANSVSARYHFGRCLALQGKLDQAIEQFSEVVRLQPENARGHFYLGLNLVSTKRMASGIEHLRLAIRLRPEWPEALGALGWILATEPEAEFRDGAEAVRLGESAARITSNQDPAVLNTLAAAYAETGRFKEAISTATKAIDLARTAGQTNLEAQIRICLDVYKKDQAFRAVLPR